MDRWVDGLVDDPMILMDGGAMGRKIDWCSNSG